MLIEVVMPPMGEFGPPADAVVTRWLKGKERPWPAKSRWS